MPVAAAIIIFLNFIPDFMSLSFFPRFIFRGIVSRISVIRLYVLPAASLLKLTVDTGIDQREIVSGIAEYFTPEELVGRQVLVLVNLQPRELKGILSRGMILMAEDASGKLRLLSPNEATNSGAVVG